MPLAGVATPHSSRASADSGAAHTAFGKPLHEPSQGAVHTPHTQLSASAQAASSLQGFSQFVLLPAPGSALSQPGKSQAASAHASSSLNRKSLTSRHRR
jgi:hypothetical protein